MMTTATTAISTVCFDACPLLSLWRCSGSGRNHWANGPRCLTMNLWHCQRWAAVFVFHQVAQIHRGQLERWLGRQSASEISTGHSLGFTDSFFRSLDDSMIQWMSFDLLLCLPACLHSLSALAGHYFFCFIVACLLYTLNFKTDSFTSFWRAVCFLFFSLLFWLVLSHFLLVMGFSKVSAAASSGAAPAEWNTV